MELKPDQTEGLLSQETSRQGTSLEHKKSELIENIKKINENAGGRVAAQFSLEQGGMVYIFNAKPLQALRPHMNISQAGISTELGPIFVIRGALGDRLTDILSKFNSGQVQELPTWNNLISDIATNHTTGPIGETRTILPFEQETWNQTLRNAMAIAERQIQTEKALQDVIPQSLATTQEILSSSASTPTTTEAPTLLPTHTSKPNLPPDQRTPASFPADDPRRTEAGGQVEPPADLRPVPEPNTTDTQTEPELHGQT